ncbi:MAG: InlB B-repeat-containing protein [Nitrososphaerota archaeon]|nr:InlB B-repeat-containing protein [Nitrososphaerota archaeon]
MFDQKMYKNRKLNVARKAITALLILSMLLGMLQTSVFAADDSLRIQVGDSASTWEDAITAANSKGSAIIEIIGDITLTSSVDITSDITLISAEGDHTITVLPVCSITIQGGTLIIGDGLSTNFLTILGSDTAVHVESGVVHIKDGSTVSAVGDYCTAIEVITGNVVVSGGTVSASMVSGHWCAAICLGDTRYPMSGGTIEVTGGTVSATRNSVYGDSFAISLPKASLAAYLKGTCTGDFDAWGNSIIVEVESLDISGSYGGTNNGLTRKAGSDISKVQWEVSGDVLAISFNNRQYAIEWATFSVCEIIDTDGVTRVGAYGSFADALAAVQDGQTIRLLCDIEYNAGIVITNKSVTFDVNGFILNVVNSAGHGLDVGTGGEVLLNNSTGGKFNVKGGGSGDQHGVYAHSGGKAEVTDATTAGSGISARGANAVGAGTVITVYGNVLRGFYGLGASAGATITVYGYVSGGGAMLVSGAGTTVTVYGDSSGGGTGVYAFNNAVVYVKGNVLGGEAGLVASSGAQVTVDGTVRAVDGPKIYAQIGGVDKMQEDHELVSSKNGYFEYKNGDSFLWVKDPVVSVVRHRETGDLYKSVSEAIAAIKPSYNAFVLEVLGDVLEKDHIIINNEDVTIVSVEGNHAVTFVTPAPSSGWKFALQGGGTLTLGEGNTENTLTILHSVAVTNGHINVKDGVIIKSRSAALKLSGSNAFGTISGGYFETTGTGDGALSLEEGAKIGEISGGEFYGAIDAVHLTGVGTRIELISGGSFYQTDPTVTLHGHAIFVQDDAQIGEISGGHFEAILNCALVVIRGGWVDEISGGEFIANRVGSGGDRNGVIWVESEGTKTGIGTISGGHVKGAHFGVLIINYRSGMQGAEISTITGGTFEGVIALQNDVRGVIGEISGGIFRGVQGMLNNGRIGVIGGQADISGTTSYGVFNFANGQIGEISGGKITSSGTITVDSSHGLQNSGVIGTISGGVITSIKGSYSGIHNSLQIGKIAGGTITSEQYGNGLSNSGTISEISGGKITGGLGTGSMFTGDQYGNGIYNSGSITLISGGIVIGYKNAINCVGSSSGGSISTILNGVFWGKTGVAIRLAHELELEPGLSANRGLGRYQSGNGYNVFNDEGLVTYPDLNGDKYFMSTLTEPVSGIDGVAFRFLALNDAYNIEYELNNGINHHDNPESYVEADLPVTIINPSRAGYTFGGWRVTYADGSTAGPVVNYNIPLGTSGDVVLSATWVLIGVEVERYDVMYNGNGFTGGVVPVDRFNPYDGGEQVTVLGQGSMTKNGYVFLGWSTISSANTAAYVAGSTFTITDDIVLYAIWAEAVYTVTFAPGAHGTFTAVSTSGLHFGDPTPMAPVVTGEAGWRFTEWTPTLTSTVTGNIIYTAQWAQNTTVTPTPTPPIVSPTPTPTPTFTATPPPSVIDGGKWALLNLILSVIGVILAVITTVHELLLKKRGVTTAAEDKHTQSSDEVDNRKFTQHMTTVWLIVSTVLGVVGVVVFLLTEDWRLLRAWVDRWTIVNAIILVAEVGAILLVFKSKTVKSSKKIDNQHTVHK